MTYIIHAGEKGKGRRRSRTDQRAHALIALLIVCLYASGMYYGLSTFGFENIKGLRFHSDVEWMNVAVSPFVVYVTPLLYFLLMIVVYVYLISTCGSKRRTTNLQRRSNCRMFVHGLGYAASVDVANGNPLDSFCGKSIEWFVFVHYLTKF